MHISFLTQCFDVMTYHPQKLHGWETDDVIIKGELAASRPLNQRLVYVSPDLLLTKFYVVTFWQQAGVMYFVWFALYTASTEWLCNREGVCLLRGTDLMFTYESV